MSKVVVTGGKGGMAQAIKVLLEKQGYTVFAPSKGVMDVTDFEAVCSYMKIIQPDILVNTAGYISPFEITGKWIDPRDDFEGFWEPRDIVKDFNKHMLVNFYGTLNSTVAALEQGCKTFINIASTSGMGGRPVWAAYCASKAVVISLTESLANEGHKAYAISPKKTNTKMRARLFPDEDSSKLMPPSRIANVVLEIITGEYVPGVNIEVRKDKIVAHLNRFRPEV